MSTITGKKPSEFNTETITALKTALGLPILSEDELAGLQGANSISAENAIATMADIPEPQGITNLTLAELSTLISTSALSKGSEYYVTDKDWWLIAISERTLDAVGDELVITTPTISLPTGVIPKRIIFDSGIITATEYGVKTPFGYNFSYAKYHNLEITGNHTIKLWDLTSLLDCSAAITLLPQITANLYPTSYSLNNRTFYPLTVKRTESTKRCRIFYYFERDISRIPVSFEIITVNSASSQSDGTDVSAMVSVSLPAAGLWDINIQEVEMSLPNDSEVTFDIQPLGISVNGSSLELYIPAFASRSLSSESVEIIFKRGAIVNDDGTSNEQFTATFNNSPL